MEIEHDNTEETSLEDSLDITDTDDTQSDDVTDTETETEEQAAAASESDETEGDESAETEGEETEEQEEPALDMSFKAGVYNKETKQVETKETLS